MLFFLALGEGGLIVGTIIGIPLAFAWGAWVVWRDRRNNPRGTRRRELLQTILRMRRQGSSYQDRLAYLRGQGLRPNVAQRMLAEAERELLEK